MHETEAILTPAAGDDAATPVRRIPIVEESLAIRKRVVDRGGYRITKEVSAIEKVIDEALRSETVDVQRRAVGTLVEGSEPPVPRHEGDTFVIPVVKEVLVTEKRLMLVEEIRIRRVQTSYRDPQRVTLRKENIVIERLEARPTE